MRRGFAISSTRSTDRSLAVEQELKYLLEPSRRFWREVSEHASHQRSLKIGGTAEEYRALFAERSTPRLGTHLAVADQEVYTLGVQTPGVEAAT